MSEARDLVHFIVADTIAPGDPRTRLARMQVCLGKQGLRELPVVRLAECVPPHPAHSRLHRAHPRPGTLPAPSSTAQID